MSTSAAHRASALSAKASSPAPSASATLSTDSPRRAKLQEGRHQSGHALDQLAGGPHRDDPALGPIS